MPVEPIKSPEPVQVTQAKNNDPEEITPAMRKMGGMVVLEGVGSSNATANPSKNNSNGTQTVQSGDSNSPIANQLKPTLFSPSNAGIRGDTSLILTRGSLIPCVLVSKIVTTYPGITRCQITKDVYSSNGKTLL